MFITNERGLSRYSGSYFWRGFQVRGVKLCNSTCIDVFLSISVQSGDSLTHATKANLTVYVMCFLQGHYWIFWGWITPHCFIQRQWHVYNLLGVEFLFSLWALWMWLTPNSSPWRSRFTTFSRWSLHTFDISLVEFLLPFTLLWFSFRAHFGLKYLGCISIFTLAVIGRT